MKKVIIFFLLLFSLFLIITGVASTCFFFSCTYNGFIEYLVKTLGKTANWIPYFKTRLSFNSFLLAKKIVVLYDIALLVIIPLLVYHSKKIAGLSITFFKGISFQLKQIISSFKTLSTFERYFFYVVIVFVFVKSIWYDTALPIQYDEAWSYNYYESNSLWESFLLPGNNHKLFTFIAWFFNLLPFSKSLLIRLPVTFGGIMLLVLFFNFAKKYFSSGVALIGFAWFATCVPVAIYMTLARSYIFVILFSLLLLQLYFRIIASDSKRFNYVLLFWIILFGYFTNPVFFFGHFILTIFTIYKLIRLKDFEKIKAIIYTHIPAFLFLLIIYVPDILGGHFKDLMSAAFKVPSNNNYFITCLKYNSWFELGIAGQAGFWLFILILIISFVLCFVKKIQPTILLQYAFISIAWLPFHALLAQDDTSIHKVIYISISVALLLMFILSAINKYLINKYVIVIISLAVIIINSIKMDNHGWLKWSTGGDESCKKVSTVLLNKNIPDCYLLNAYYKPGIQFYFKVNAKPIKLYLSDSSSVDYSPTASANATSVLMDKGADSLINKTKYGLVYEDKYVVLYQRKN